MVKTMKFPILVPSWPKYSSQHPVFPWVLFLPQYKDHVPLNTIVPIAIT